MWKQVSQLRGSSLGNTSHRSSGIISQPVRHYGILPSRSLLNTTHAASRGNCISLSETNSASSLFGAPLQHKQSLFQNIYLQIPSIRGFASLPSHQEVGLPALSPSMERGNIAKWRKKEGDKIKASDVIAEIETDKATVDFEATEEGYLAKILYPDGSKDIAVGTPICITVEKAEDVAAFKNYKGTGAPAPPAPKQAEPEKQAPSQPAKAPTPPPAQQSQPTGPWVPGAPPPPTSGGISPLARVTAAQVGVDVSQLAGTGPQGRVIQADVLEQRAQPQARPTIAVPVAAGAQYTDIPVTQIRKVIAERLTQSKQQIPHYYLTVDCRIDALAKLRTALNEKAKGEFKLSVNDFVVKAAALACKKIPEANSSWLGDNIRRYHNVDINVAVNTDRGLLTPIIKDADKIGLAAINKSVKDLAERAKIGKLSPNELASGTFTISNLGMFGIKQFAAVINPPQACILAVGGSEKRLILEEGSNNYHNAEFMSVTLSADHRVVDGAVGAQWLQKFKQLIEDPTTMLL